LADLLVDGGDVVAAWAVVEDAYDGGMSAVDRADNATFGAAVGSYVDDFNQNEVAVHGGTNGWRRDKDIAGEPGFQRLIEGSGVGSDKAEAIAMHTELSYDHVLAGDGMGESIVAGIDLDKLAAGNQAFEAVGEVAAGITVEAHLAD
jgi:hypothetical protein